MDDWSRRGRSPRSRANHSTTSFCRSDRPATILAFDKPARNGEHPTMKPTPLFLYLLQNSCLAGGIVIDPFGGSGTTLIVAEQSGRHARLMELDPRYCDVIVRRWEQFTGKQAVRPNTQPAGTTC